MSGSDDQRSMVRTQKTGPANTKRSIEWCACSVHPGRKADGNGKDIS